LKKWCGHHADIPESCRRPIHCATIMVNKPPNHYNVFADPYLVARNYIWRGKCCYINSGDTVTLQIESNQGDR
jgi:hypothetical protein